MTTRVSLRITVLLSGLVMSTSDCVAESPISPPSNTATEQAAKYSMSHQRHTFIVMFDGKVIAEEYAAGGGPDRLQMLASGSKSFVGVAAATYRRFDATDDMPTSPRLSACPAPSVPREPTLSASSQRCGLIEAPSATNTLRPTYEKGQAND